MAFKDKETRWQGSNWCRPERRVAIYLRDIFTCLACNTDLSNAPPRDIHLDHLEPRSGAGNNDASNLVTICITCNSQRHDMPWREFYSPEAQARVEATIAKPLNVRLAKAVCARLGGTEVAGSSARMIKALRGQI
jgi:hypothetical protein